MDREEELRREIAEIRGILDMVSNPDRELLHSMYYLRLLIAGKQRRLVTLRQSPSVLTGGPAA